MTSRTEKRERWMRDVLDRFERPLVAYVHRRIGDLEAARDIVQESLLRLCRADPPPGEGHLRPWLYRVSRNLAIDHLRKEGRMQSLKQTDGILDASSGHAPAHGAQQADERSRLARCVSELSPRQQEVVRLRFQDALSYREIAVVTGASVSHVGVLLHQAMSALRGRLAAVEGPAACERRTS